MGNNGIVEQFAELKKIRVHNSDLGFELKLRFEKNEFIPKNWDDITDEQFVTLFLDLDLSDRFLKKMFRVSDSKVGRCRQRLNIGTWNSPKNYFDWYLLKRYEKVINLDQFIKEISV